MASLCEPGAEINTYFLLSHTPFLCQLLYIHDYLESSWEPRIVPISQKRTGSKEAVTCPRQGTHPLFTESCCPWESSRHSGGRLAGSRVEGWRGGRNVTCLQAMWPKHTCLALVSICRQSSSLSCPLLRCIIGSASLHPSTLQIEVVNVLEMQIGLKLVYLHPPKAIFPPPCRERFYIILFWEEIITQLFKMWASLNMYFCPFLSPFANQMAVLVYDLCSRFNLGRHNKSQQNGKVGKTGRFEGSGNARAQKKAGTLFATGCTPLLSHPGGTQVRPTEIKEDPKLPFKEWHYGGRNHMI